MAAQKKKQSLVNLLPQNEFESSVVGRILKWILTTFRVIVITVELVVILGFLSRFWLDLRNSDLTDEIKQKEALVESYFGFEKEFKRTQKKIEIFSLASDEKNDTLPLITSSVRRLPIDIQLLSFSRTDKILEVKGSSLSEQSIAQFLVNLADEKSLDNVSLVQVESRAESPFIRFTLRADISVEEGAQDGS
jgi:Tfp pilus assembly protein PilN